MLRTVNFIAIFLLALGETMLFAANKHDPINASVLMLAMLLLAISSLRFLFLFVPYAALTNRFGSLFLIFGFFGSAFFQFDIMAFGVTEHSSHFGKTLFIASQVLLVLGSGLLGLWLYPLGKTDKSLGITLPIAMLVFAAPRFLGLSASAQLVTALMLCATLAWLAIYKIQRY